jgi:hypothetical protein
MYTLYGGKKIFVAAAKFYYSLYVRYLMPS